ncbi:MAG: hypothetical protein JOY71_27295 [Acetobacteraceae bacterium]|nr:hypothetical protein [Acetobacteraceae bacterium]MBV8525774.1 hypothetical protein [Acetobacteraceae bacterium]MBV8591846.1 hypothetical protein [Acetobacteraceae bacterium]
MAESDENHLRLAELLCSRLCHDLSGPVSSLLGALELAQEDGGSREEAFTIARESAVVLRRRLELLRLAWGQHVEALSIPKFRTLLAGLPRAHRLQVDLSGLDPRPELSPELSRLLLNLLLLAAESLPGGGRVAIAGSPARDIMIMIEGPRAAWPAGLVTAVIEPEAALQSISSPRAFPTAFLALLALRIGARLSFLMPAGARAQSAPPALLVSLV